MKVLVDSVLNQVLTIVFQNMSCDPPTTTVWVCANRERYDHDLNVLKKLNHLKIIADGLTPLHE